MIELTFLMHALRRWVWNLLVSLDQLGNTLLGGEPDETISSRAGKRAAQGSKPAKTLCWVLDRIDPGHCGSTIEPDRGAPAPQNEAIPKKEGTQ